MGILPDQSSYTRLQVDDEDGECYDDDEYQYDTDDSNGNCAFIQPQ